MGLLDDAIREHLDLKRRRGADPAEIERAEQEALGPVRREPIGSEEGIPEAASDVLGAEPAAPLADAESAPSGPPGGVPSTAETYGDEPDNRPEIGEDEDWGDHEDGDFEHDEDVEPGHHDPGPDAAARPPMAPAETGPSAPLAPDPDEALGDTASYDLDQPPHRPAGESGEEDVLEETPEFLQDTPDHDRLWFEQRPPRDFDFDE